MTILEYDPKEENQDRMNCNSQPHASDWGSDRASSLHAYDHCIKHEIGGEPFDLTGPDPAILTIHRLRKSSGPEGVVPTSLLTGTGSISPR